MYHPCERVTQSVLVRNSTHPLLQIDSGFVRELVYLMGTQEKTGVISHTVFAASLCSLSVRAFVSAREGSNLRPCP